MRCIACAALSLSSLKPPRKYANVKRSLLLLKKFRRAVQKARRKHHQVAQGQGHLAAPPRPRRALLHVRLRELRGRSWAVGQLGSWAVARETTQRMQCSVSYSGSRFHNTHTLSHTGRSNTHTLTHTGRSWAVARLSADEPGACDA
jgi:hypothetical protein